MAWLPFVIAMIELFAKCREEREQDEIVEDVREMRPVVVFASYRLAVKTIRKEEGLRGKKLRKKARGYVDRVANASPAELEEMAATAEALYLEGQE